MLAVFTCLHAAQAQLTANFTADTTQGCSPLLVRFSDRSTGGPTSWSWDLGNGSQSTQKNPTSLFFNPGTYTVKLVVRNAAGADSIVKTQYVRVFSAPQVSFRADDTIGCVPLPVQFSNQSSAGSGTITASLWDVGDGTLHTEENPRHVYQIPGIYTITLKVTNSAGCTRTVSRPSYINVGAGVKAGFNFTGQGSCTSPAVVQFNNTSIGGGSLTYRWYFGPNDSSTARNPVYNYATSGTYPVKLVVRNQFGCSDSLSLNVVVSITDNKASFTTSGGVCAGSQVQFTNTSTPGATATFWNFGDGTSSFEISPLKTYDSAGTYSVQMINLFGTCTDTIVRNIVVYPKPSAGFTGSFPPAGCTLPVSVSFTHSSGNIASYLWNFGDNSTSTVQSPVHAYTNYGDYNVSLQVTDINGCRDTATATQTIRLFPPAITRIDGLPFRGCAPVTRVMMPEIVSPEPIAAYLWDFGDGTTSTIAEPTHTWTTPGTYNVSLTITTVNGCTATLAIATAIDISERPNAAFVATPISACANQYILFTDLSTGNVTSWEWNFGDGATSTIQHPSHYYSDTGKFTITLTVKNRSCEDTLVLEDYIYIKPPVAYFTKRMYCDRPLLREFFDLSIGAATWQWSFGDGNTSTLQNPVHTYAQPGVYHVELIVFNDSCSNEYNDTVIIVNDFVDYTVTDTMFCHETQTRFSVLRAPASIVNYSWDFGDGGSSSGSDTAAFHGYVTAGNYTTRLETTDILGCKNIITKPVTIDILGPDAGFTNPPGACISSPVVFTDTSGFHPSYPVARRIWDFGDGTKRDTSITTTITHVYTREGVYTVKLIVVDTYGCLDSLQVPSAIIISNPQANFSISDTLKCTNNQLGFTNQSTGRTLQYAWNFGDGGTSDVQDPSRSYTTEGRYTVSLTVTDDFGCTNTRTDDSLVRIADPVAAFSLSDSGSNCPPFVAVMYPLIANHTSLLWDFGDGSFSAIDTPSHYYNTAGNYDIKLTVNGYGNCNAMASYRVIIGGPRGTIDYQPLRLCAPGQASFIGHTENTTTFIWDFGDGTIQTSADSTAVHIYETPGSYLPRLLMRDSVGCTVPIMGDSQIVVSQVTAAIGSLPNAYCDSATVAFSNNSLLHQDVASAYSWNFGDGDTSNNASPVHHFDAPGNYNVSLRVTTQNGCVDTTSTLVKVVHSPEIRLGGDSAICIDGQAVFRGELLRSDTSQLEWQWDFDNGMTSAAQNPPSQTYTAAKSYAVRLTTTNSSGCTDTDTRILVVHPLPAVSAGKDSIICLGQAIQLQATGAATYLWAPDNSLSCTNCPSPLAQPSFSNNVYSVTGTSTQGCKATDTMQVTVVFPTTLQVSGTDTLCEGEVTHFLASGADRYIWSPASALSDASIANPTATPSVTTNFQVVGSDNRSCFTDTAFIPIVVYPKPLFTIINNNISAPAGTVVPIQTTSSADITGWRWLPSLGLSCNNCAEPVLTAFRDMTFRAIAFNPGGCSTESTLKLTVTCNDDNVYIPNTFSPNNDGANDVFFPRGKGIATARSLKIFNRWGGVVFQKNNFTINDHSAGWNGLYNNQPAPADVYVYQLEVICQNNQILFYKGNLSLVR